MIVLYTIVFAAFLSKCIGSVGGGCFSLPCIQHRGLPHSDYEGDPIKFACVTTDAQRQFLFTSVNGSIPSTLVDQLSNKKGISLFFHGATNVIDSSFELFFLFAKLWYRKSGKNICIVSYAFKNTKTSSKISKMSPIVKKMVETGRLKYVAEMARDLVFGVREKGLKSKSKRGLKHLSQVDVSGFSFGAHIAGRTCQYLLKVTGEKVRLLLALNPIKIPAVGPKNCIRPGDASYVQVIHTSQEEGIWDQLGDVDIYVKYDGDMALGDLSDRHGIAFLIHLGTSTKRLYLKADLGEEKEGAVRTYAVSPEKNECLIGVYGTLNSSWHRGGNYSISLKQAGLQYFWEGIGEVFQTLDLFHGNKEAKKEYQKRNKEDNGECLTCCVNKKSAILYPCKHKDVCVTCWNKWEAEQHSSIKRCPMCKLEVLDIEKDLVDIEKS